VFGSAIAAAFFPNLAHASSTTTTRTLKMEYELHLTSRQTRFSSTVTLLSYVQECSNMNYPATSLSASRAK